MSMEIPKTTLLLIFDYFIFINTHIYNTILFTIIRENLLTNEKPHKIKTTVVRKINVLFQLYHGGQFYWWWEPKYPEETTD